MSFLHKQFDSKLTISSTLPKNKSLLGPFWKLSPFTLLVFGRCTRSVDITSGPGCASGTAGYSRGAWPRWRAWTVVPLLRDHPRTWWNPNFSSTSWATPIHLMDKNGFSFQFFKPNHLVTAHVGLVWWGCENLFDLSVFFFCADPPFRCNAIRIEPPQWTQIKHHSLIPHINIKPPFT